METLNTQLSGNFTPPQMWPLTIPSKQAHYSNLQLLEIPMHVLLADDQPQVRSALKLLLEQEGDFEVMGEAVNSENLLAQAQRGQPNLILLDWELPGRAMINLLPLLRQAAPNSQIVVLSSRLEAHQAALTAGSDAFISKGDPPEHLLAILRGLKAKQKKRAV